MPSTSMLCCLIKESILDKLVQMTTTMQPREECPHCNPDSRQSNKRSRTRNLCGRMGCKLDANSNPPITLSLSLSVSLGVIRTEVSQQRERATFRRRRHCKIEREIGALLLDSSRIACPFFLPSLPSVRRSLPLPQ